jgi:transposase-like protein
MSAPRKYEPEFRERAVRLYRDRLAEAVSRSWGRGGRSVHCWI